MRLEAIYTKPRLSQGGLGRKIYPYLLSGVHIERTNQVWSTDIPYVRLRQGFVYLVAVMDWYSRYVLSRADLRTPCVAFAMRSGGFKSPFNQISLILASSLEVWPILIPLFWH